MPDIEEQIRRAQQEGKFDNLPGKGKPLKLDENPFADPEWRMAYHLLVENGFALPWMELRQEIENELTQARMELQRAWKYRQDALVANPSEAMVEAQWQRARQAFCHKVEALNRRIFDYNIQAPSDLFQRVMINAAREMEAICAR